MPRTDADAVKAILGDDYNRRKAPALTPYITAADSIVDDLVAWAEDEAPTTEKQAVLAAWLAAHAYVQMDPAYTSKNTNKSGGSFTGTFGEGLKNSRYGQFAITLDSSGYLAELADPTPISEKPVAGGFWGGLPRSQQRDYDQRNG